MYTVAIEMHGKRRAYAPRFSRAADAQDAARKAAERTGYYHYVLVQAGLGRPQIAASYGPIRRHD